MSEKTIDRIVLVAAFFIGGVVGAVLGAGVR